MGDGLSDVMEHRLLSESPALLLGFHVAWIFLSNIVLVGFRFIFFVILGPNDHIDHSSGCFSK